MTAKKKGKTVTLDNSRPVDTKRAYIREEYGILRIEDTFAGDLADIIQNLTALKQRIMLEYKEKNQLVERIDFVIDQDVDTGYYGDSACIEDNSMIMVLRDETDDEWEERIAANVARRAQTTRRKEAARKLAEERKAEVEEAERELFNKLKEKYGETNES